MADRTFARPAEPEPEGGWEPKFHTFTLGGRGQLTGQQWEATFRCLWEAPAGALDDLSRSISVNDQLEEVYDRVSVVRFFVGVLHPDDTKPFRDLVADKDKAVQLKELGDTMLWLSEVYTGRPTRLSPS